MVNQFVYLEQPGAVPAVCAPVTRDHGATGPRPRMLKDYSHAKNAIWGISGARNP